MTKNITKIEIILKFILNVLDVLIEDSKTKEKLYKHCLFHYNNVL